MILKKKDNIVLRYIHGLHFLIDTQCDYLNDKCYLYELNEIGAFLWGQLDEYTSIKNLARSLGENIIGDVDEQQILSDVEEYISILVNEGFVELQHEEE